MQPRSRSSEPCSSCRHGNRRVVGGVDLAALPTPVSTGSGSKGFSQSLRRLIACASPVCLGYPWRPSGIIPTDHTIMLHMRNVLLISFLLAAVVTMVYAQAP